MPLLSCRGLTRRPFFEDVHLALEPGEIVCLTGPSGSGKSLFLRAVADLDPTDAGEVELAGEERSAVAPETWRRRVLYVQQSAPSLDGTVTDDLARFAELGGGEPESSAALPALDGSLATARLSGGEAQLLALHRALRASPTVLLLDEGTANLDPALRGTVEAALTDWVESERAILWVTHDDALAGRLGARKETFPCSR